MSEELSGNDAHLELGAYVLDALEPAERVAFERHLAGCPQCRAELADWSVLPPLLGRVPLPVVLADPDLGGLLDEDLILAAEAGADPGLAELPNLADLLEPDLRDLDWPGRTADRGRPEPAGLPGQADRRATPAGPHGPGTTGPRRAGRRPRGRVGSRRRPGAHAAGARSRGSAPVGPGTTGSAGRPGSRGRRYIAAVVGALVLFLGGALGLNQLTDESSHPAVTFALVAPPDSVGAAGTTGVASGTAELRSSGSGSTVKVSVSGIAPGTECVVLVTGPDGRTVQVTTWTATYYGKGSATARTAIAPAGIRAVAIRDGATNGTLMAGRRV